MYCEAGFFGMPQCIILPTHGMNSSDIPGPKLWICSNLWPKTQEVPLTQSPRLSQQKKNQLWIEIAPKRLKLLGPCDACLNLVKLSWLTTVTNWKGLLYQKPSFLAGLTCVMTQLNLPRYTVLPMYALPHYIYTYCSLNQCTENLRPIILRNIHCWLHLHPTKTLRSLRIIYDDEIPPWIQPHEEVKTQNYKPTLKCHGFLTSTILPCLLKNLHPIFHLFSNIKKMSDQQPIAALQTLAATRFNRSQTWHPRPPATSRRLSAFGSTERCPHVPATYQAKKRLAKGLLCFTMVYPVYPLN